MLGHRYGWCHASDSDGKLLERTFDVASGEYPWLLGPDYRDRSITEIEILHRFLRKEKSDKSGVLVYFRESSPEKYVDKGKAAEGLQRLKDRLLESGVPVKTYSSAAQLAEFVQADLTRLVDLKFPQAITYSEFEEENDSHELYGFCISSVYVGGARFYPTISEHLDGLGGPLMIEGEHGAGKSARVASYFQTERCNDETLLTILHFVGTTENSRSHTNAIFRFMTICKEELDIEKTVPAQSNAEELINAFPEWIQIASMRAAVMQRKLVFVMDGIDNFLDVKGMSNFNWLPEQFPNNFFLIVTSLENTDYCRTLRQRKWRIEYMETLSVEERTDFAEDYLVRQYSKKLRDDQMSKLVNGSNMGQPMRLTTVCEELRRHGQFFTLDKKLQSLLDCESMTDLYGMTLDRLEVEFEDQKDKLIKLLGIIHISRIGLSHDDIQHLVGLPNHKVVSIFANIESWFIERNGLTTFMHPQLKAVVKRRYLTDHQYIVSLHREIAEFFGDHYRGTSRCIEAVWHSLFLDDPEQLLKQVSDLESLPFLFADGFRQQFLECCRAAGGYEAVMMQCLVNLSMPVGSIEDDGKQINAEVANWHRKQLVATFGKEVGLYDQSALLLVDLAAHTPDGITKVESAEVLVLLQEMYWRYKVSPPDGAEKGPEAIRLLKVAEDMLKGTENTQVLSQVYHSLGLVNLIFFRAADGSNDKTIGNYLQKALDIRKENREYSAAGDTLNVLGDLAQKQKQYEEAKNYFIRSLELREQVLSKNSPDIAQVNTSLGSLYFEMQDFQKAKQFYLRARDIYAVAIGTEHPRIVPALEGLVNVYRELNDHINGKSVTGVLARITAERH